MSQLQDDNQNVSSRLASCNYQLQTTQANLSSLQSAVQSLESQMEPLLTETVLPKTSTSSPPDLEPIPDLPSSKPSQVQAKALPKVQTGPDILTKVDREGPRDKRDSESTEVDEAHSEG